VHTFLSLVFSVYSFKDDASLMYKFNTELFDKENTNDDANKARHSSAASSIISSLPSESDAVLEYCFEMLAQLAPEALVCASLTKRSSIVHTCV